MSTRAPGNHATNQSIKQASKPASNHQTLLEATKQASLPKSTCQTLVPFDVKDGASIYRYSQEARIQHQLLVAKHIV